MLPEHICRAAAHGGNFHHELVRIKRVRVTIPTLGGPQPLTAPNSSNEQHQPQKHPALGTEEVEYQAASPRRGYGVGTPGLSGSDRLQTAPKGTGFARLGAAHRIRSSVARSRNSLINQQQPQRTLRLDPNAGPKTEQARPWWRFPPWSLPTTS